MDPIEIIIIIFYIKSFCSYYITLCSVYNIFFYIGVLVPELLICLVQLEALFPSLIHETLLIPMLSQLLDYLDKFNRLAPGLDKENSADLLWQGIPSKINIFINNYL